MQQEHVLIGRIPAILWGTAGEGIHLYVHGQHGRKEEAERFAAAAAASGWQVLSIDRPGHGEREAETDAFVPWQVVPELKQALDWARGRQSRVALRANSIGAWFSLLSFPREPLERCLFVSPVLDMERLIRDMMGWANVTEAQLEREKSISTDFGQTLSWEYLSYARSHPVRLWPWPTAILYAGGDRMTSLETVDRFTAQFGCDLAVLESGEHGFHTPSQLAFLDKWTRNGFEARRDCRLLPGL